MLDFLYGVIISPIKFVLGIFYFMLYRVFSSEGFAIVGLSAIVTLLVLPLYNMADAWQDEEREKQRKMKSKLDDIKAAFRGDERHMITNTYYRQQHYHPLMQLRSIIGVAIQVPFFIAAYHYLSHLTVLDGVSFLFLKDLSKPDGLLKIGSFSINIMPILMTVINLMSAAVYGKKLTGKEIGQLVFMALVFLVLLYTSPSGLVLYWTMNNVFSLIKNIFHRTAQPGRNFRLMITGVFWGLFLFCIYTLIPQIAKLFTFIKPSFSLTNRLTLCIVFAILTLISYFLPQIFIRAKTYGIFNKQLRDETRKDWNILFILSCSLLAMLAGLVVPSSLISSSPLEFINLLSEKSSPLDLIGVVLPQALGLFAFYPLMIYCLFKERVKYPLVLLWLAIAVGAIINIFAFPANYGVILPNLKFENTLTPEMIGEQKQFLNLLVLYLACIGVFFLFYFKKQKWISSCLGICIIAVMLMSIQNLAKTNKEYKEYLLSSGNEQQQSTDKIEPFFKFSKTRQNIVVIMLDRAIGSYFEEILKYDPSLKQKFSGFTYYPNTVSFAGHTIMGAPPIFGGYEYTPIEMNKREDKLLVDKHNEALKMMPVLFKNVGYDIAFSDPPWAGYKDIPQTNILKDAEIRCENFQLRYAKRYNKEILKNSQKVTSETRDNLIRFSLLRKCPLIARIFFYNNGNYLDINQLNEKKFSNVFLGNCAQLDYLPELCSYDSDIGGGLFMDSGLVHSFQDGDRTNYFLNMLKNRFKLNDNYNFPYQRFYLANSCFSLQVLSFEFLAEWFEKLKSENVYDNTKIIIVSDHGFPVKTNLFTNFPKLVANPFFTNPDGAISNEYAYFNPLLLVKDFNATGEVKTSLEFMTNADIPTIAVSHLAKDLQKNPFTGKEISSKEKNDDIKICTSMKFRPSDHGKYKFNIGKDEVVHVKDNIFDAKNWTQVDYIE